MKDIVWITLSLGGDILGVYSTKEKALQDNEDAFPYKLDEGIIDE